MKNNESSKCPIIKDKNSPFHSCRDKIIYKNYIYNLFRYNQNKVKKIEEKNNSNQKFKAIINSLKMPIKKKSKKKILLNLNSYENNKFNHLSPRNIKNLNNSYLKDLKISNYPKKSIKNIIPSLIYKTKYKSRNNDNYEYLDLINIDNSSMNKLYSYTFNTNFTGINNPKNNTKNKFLILSPYSKRQLRTEIYNNQNYNNNYNNVIKGQDKNNIKRIVSVSFNNKMNKLSDKKTEESIEKPISQSKKNKIKITLYRDVNDMKPRNRFRLLRRELIVEDAKINKMYMKFKKQISKNQVNQVLINWIKSIENKGFLKV